MVGHTGIYQAAVIAVEAVDLCLGKADGSDPQGGGNPDRYGVKRQCRGNV